ncbi:MAG: HepT-like ribonuclease domain-containing protein [Anaerolineales bacterium]
MLEKLQRLENNVAQLRRFQAKYTMQNVRADTHLAWALRYGLFEAIQIIIDVSCHLVTREGLGTPRNYAECIQSTGRCR